MIGIQLGRPGGGIDGDLDCNADSNARAPGPPDPRNVQAMANKLYLARCRLLMTARSQLDT